MHINKKEALRLWLGTHTEESQEFLDVVDSICKDWNMPSAEPAEKSAIFAKLQELKSFNEVGPTLKLARWGSINEA